MRTDYDLTLYGVIEKTEKCSDFTYMIWLSLKNIFTQYDVCDDLNRNDPHSLIDLNALGNARYLTRIRSCAPLGNYMALLEEVSH